MTTDNEINVKFQIELHPDTLRDLDKFGLSFNNFYLMANIPENIFFQQFGQRLNFNDPLFINKEVNTERYATGFTSNIHIVFAYPSVFIELCAALWAQFRADGFNNIGFNSSNFSHN